MGSNLDPVRSGESDIAGWLAPLVRGGEAMPASGLLVLGAKGKDAFLGLAPCGAAAGAGEYLPVASAAGGGAGEREG